NLVFCIIRIARTMELPSLSSLNKEKFLGHSGNQSILILRIFLNFSRPLIVIFPPFSKTWDNLQSVWCKRFLEEIAHLGTNVNEKSTGKNNLSPSCGICVDSSRRVNPEQSTGNNNLSPSCGICVDSSRRVNPEQSTGNNNLSPSCGICVDSSRRVNPEQSTGKNNLSPSCGIPYICVDSSRRYFSWQIKREFRDIEYFRMFWSSIILHRKNKIRDMENEITKEESNENIRNFIEHFESSYKGLDEEKKWILGSGNKVEDIIYKYGSTLKHENLVHSFVLDTDDKNIRDLFSANEWNEILENNSKKSPKIESDLLYYITRYRKARISKKTNVKDLREAVSKLCKKTDNDVEEQFDYIWIRNCISNLLTLYEIKPRVFEKSHLERWYDTNIWSSIIDQCMWNLKDVELIRGESCSIASSERKAKNRILQVRKPLGRRGDGVFRMEKGLCEYGAAEHGRLFQGEKDKKFMSDGFKLTRMLRDMLGRFSAELSTEVLKQIEMVGYLHSERMLQIFVLDYAEGYMIRLRKGALLEVPKEPVNIDNLLKLITAVLSSKLRISRTISLLQTPEQSNDLEFTKELSTADQIERVCSNNQILDLPDPPSSPPSRNKSLLYLMGA
ncbi:2459_t:CDS:10, partial [Funneliformis caledonium]